MQNSGLSLEVEARLKPFFFNLLKRKSFLLRQVCPRRLWRTTKRTVSNALISILLVLAQLGATACSIIEGIPAAGTKLLV
jgi:hypothetical protein